MVGTSAVEREETGAGIDHGLLTGLGDDDHTQYALLAGRAGGQTLVGGTGATDNLTLKPSTTAGAASIVMDLSASISNIVNITGAAAPTGAQTMFSINAGQTITMGSGARVSALVVGGTYDHNHPSPNAIPYLVFSWNPTIQIRSSTSGAANTTDLESPSIYRSTPTIRLKDGNAYGGLAANPFAVFHSIATFTRDAAETATVASYANVLLSDVWSAGWTITNLRGFYWNLQPGAGTITNLIVLDIDDPVALGYTLTNPPIAYRSVGTTLQMRHGGPAVFGTTGAPNTTQGVDIAGDLATRASAFTASNGANNDIAIGATSFVRITGPTAAFNISGIAGGFDGKRVILYNTTTQNMTINDESAASTAANRITTTTGADIVTAGQGSIEVFYDSTGARWVVTGNVL